MLYYTSKQYNIQVFSLKGNSFLDGVLYKKNAKQVTSAQKDIINNFNKQKMSLEAFEDVFDNISDVGLRKYLETTEAGQASTKGLAKSLAQPVSALGKFGKALGGTVLNMAGYALASIAVEKTLSAIATAWDNYSNKQEKAIEKGNETLTTHKDNIQKYADSAKVVDNVGKRFEELRKGVSSSGKNIGLTTDEFAEYQNIVSQLATSMPSLVNGYDSLGNPIISATTNVKQLTEALQEQQRTLSQENINKAKDYKEAFDSVMNQTPTDYTQESGLKQQEQLLNQMFSDVNAGKSIADKYFGASKAETWMSGHLGKPFWALLGDPNMGTKATLGTIKDKKDNPFSLLVAEDIAEAAGINEQVLEQIRKGKKVDAEVEQYVQDKLAAYQKQIDSQKESYFSNTKPLLESMLMGDDNGINYNSLKDTTKDALSQVINSMKYADAEASGMIDEFGSLDTDKFKSWADGVANNIKQSGVEDSLEDLFSLKDKSGEMGYKEYMDETNSLVNSISSKVPELSSALLKSTTGLGDNLNDLKQKRLDLVNDGFNESLLNELSNSDMEILWDLNADGVVSGAENAKKAIENFKKVAEESNPNKFFDAWQQATQTANQGSKYDTMRSGFESAYDAYKKGLVGTDDFKTFAAMVSPTGADDARNFAENYPKFQRYFTEGQEGVNNFLGDISSLVDGTGQAFAQLNQDTGRWKFNVTDAQDLATRLGIGVEMVGAMFGKMQEYGIENNFVSDVESGAKRTGDLVSALTKENRELKRLESKSADDKYGYNTDAGEHTVGDQTAINESRKKIQQYNEDIQETAKNTRALIKTQNEGAESQQKAAIAAAKALNEQKEAAKEAGLQDTADAIQGQIDALGNEFFGKDGAVKIKAEIEFDADKATENVESLLNSAWRKSDSGGGISRNLDNIAQKIQEIGEHGGDISALVPQFNDLAEISGSVFRMDSEGQTFTFGEKISEIQELANEVQSLSSKGADASTAMSNMASEIKSLASAGGDINGLVDQYNSLAETTGSEYRMEVTGEIVSVEDYTGDEVEVKAKVSVDTSGLASEALSALSKWGDDTISIPVEVAMQDSGFSDVVNRIHELTNGNHEIALHFGLEGNETPEQIAQGLLNGTVNIPTQFEVTNAEDIGNVEGVTQTVTRETDDSQVDTELPEAKQKAVVETDDSQVKTELPPAEQSINVTGTMTSADTSGVGDTNIDVRGTLTSVDTVGVNSVSVPVKGQLTSVDTTGISSASIPTKGRLTSIDTSGVGDTTVNVRGVMTGVDGNVGDKSANVTFNKNSSAVDGYQPADKTATVKFNKNSSAVDGYQPPDKTATVTYSLNAPAPPNYPNMSRTVTYTIETVGKAPAYRGTANPNGSAFAQGSTRTASRVGGLYPIPQLSARALAMGTLQDDTWLNPNWRTKKPEVALTGEVGQELVVFFMPPYTVMCMKNFI